MRILAIEHERKGVSPADYQPHLVAEAQRVWELQQADIVREIYFRGNRPGAVLILECAGESEAQAHLDTLPLVCAGLIEFEVIPLAPYPGYARLFASTD